ncbi:MAG TPA: transposase [Bryocella sp.]|nr:transposase [Bryocella sp.]
MWGLQTAVCERVIAAALAAANHDEMRLATREIRTYFVTFSTADRRRVFQVEERAELMVEILQHYRSTRRFALHRFVVMPDHLHLLITPAEDVSLEKAIQFVRGGFSFRLKSKFSVWERAFR